MRDIIAPVVRNAIITFATGFLFTTGSMVAKKLAERLEPKKEEDDLDLPIAETREEEL